MPSARASRRPGWSTAEVAQRRHEARGLTWDHVHLTEEDGVPPHVNVWQTIREGGDTKTRNSRRTLGLRVIAVEALRRQRAWQQEKRREAGPAWQETGLVFSTGHGTEMSHGNACRDFRKALRGVPGIDADDWTPLELRHTYVSLMSAEGVALEEVSRLVGHTNTVVTETVYRKELRPVLRSGADAIDKTFKTKRAAGTDSGA